MNRSARKLLRLKRLTELVYRQEAAKAASAVRTHRELLYEAEATAAFMDEQTDRSSFVHELALAHLSRLNVQTAAAGAAAATQMNATIEALSIRQGVETAVTGVRAEEARQMAQQILQEIIDRSSAASRKG